MSSKHGHCDSSVFWLELAVPWQVSLFGGVARVFEMRSQSVVEFAAIGLSNLVEVPDVYAATTIEALLCHPVSCGNGQQIGLDGRCACGSWAARSVSGAAGEDSGVPGCEGKSNVHIAHA